MTIVVNTLLEVVDTEAEPKPILRVLCLHNDQVALIDIRAPRADVEWVAWVDLETRLMDGSLRIIPQDPYAPYIQPTDTDLTESQRQKRDDRFRVIEPIIHHNQGLTIYFPRERSKLFAQIHREQGVSRSALYDWVQLWLQRGQTRNALIPDYHKVGNKGKAKGAGTKKRGRPRKLPAHVASDAPTGINITPDVQKLIQRGMDKHFVKGGHSFRRAYKRMLDEYFNDGYELVDGVQVPIPRPADQVPTYDQVYYWYNKYRDPEHELRHRKGRNYPLEVRPIDGDRFMLTDGPGHYQIDGVHIGVHLAHHHNAAAIVGKAIGIFMIDTWSSYITGFDISHDNESWMTHTLAFENMATDKVAFCSQYDIAIRPEQWVSQHLPRQILADRGPMESYHADQLAYHLDIEVINTPAYRADLKGLIERNFRTFWDEILEDLKLPGQVRDAQRGERDTRLDAALTAYELMQILIHFVLWHNNDHRMNTYPLTPEMMRAGVQPYPAQIWEWGLAHRSGLLRRADPQHVRMALLPKGKAAIEREGIRFKGLHYRNEVVERHLHSGQSRNLRVLDKGRRKPRLSVSYDPRLVDTIYVRLKGGQRVEVCHLSMRQADQRFKGWRWEDVEAYRAEQRQQQRTASPSDRRQVNLRNARIGSIVAASVQRREDATQHMTQTERKANIRANREAARFEEHQRRVEDAPLPAPGEGAALRGTDSPPEITGYVANPSRAARIRDIRDKKQQSSSSTEEPSHDE